LNELDNDEKDQLKKYLKNFAKRAFNSKNKEKLYDTNKLLFSFFNCEYSELLTLPPDFSENHTFECFLKIQAIAPPTSDIYRAVKWNQESALLVQLNL